MIPLRARALLSFEEQTLAEPDQKLLELVDGVLPIRAISRLARISDDEAVARFERLFDRGVVSFARAQSSSPKPRVEERSGEHPLDHDRFVDRSRAHQG